MTREGRALVGLVLGAATIAVACVLVEPPQELPIPLPRRPLILHTSVQPPQEQPLTAATILSFRVYVDAEPSKAINYRIWVDFGSGNPPLQRNDATVLADLTGAPRPVDFAVVPAELGEPGFCHTIKLVVAYDFFPVSNTPTTEGDEVTWSYRPNGDNGGCISLDGGGIPDAGAMDASDGASE